MLPKETPLHQGSNAEIQSLYSNEEFRIYQEAIEKMQNNDDQLPSLPSITLAIRNATLDPFIPIPKLCSLIAKDPSLSVILMKHASSVFYRTAEKPKNLQDVVIRLGMTTVERLTLAHSVKSLFVLRNRQLKKLYEQTWHRQTLKASMSFYLAKTLHLQPAENALLASLLSEVGTLSLLSILQNHRTPSEHTYKILCQTYSKHLSAILLAKWGVAAIFTDVLRKTGLWTLSSSNKLELIDVINLALFHSIHHLTPNNDLPPLQELAAFKKLTPLHNEISKNGTLSIIENNIIDIENFARDFK